ncbi:type IV toxin-antitoxin system AbiEi family antitoxin [Elusimicrobiota bacterium]
MTQTTLEGQIGNVLKQVLCGLVPGCKILRFQERPRIGGVAADLLLKVKIGGSEKIFICEIRPRGEPRYILEALGLLSLAAKKVPGAYPVVIVPSISEEGKKLCQEAGAGFISLTGEAFLQFGSVYVDRQLGQAGKAPNSIRAVLKKAGEPQKIRKLPFPFSSKAARILRVALENPKESWTIARLSSEAKVALRMASLAVNWLADKLLVTKERGSVKLAKPKELLDLWVQRYQFLEMNKAVGYYSPDRSFEEFKSRLKALPEKKQDQYSLTLYGGAALAAPYLRFGVNHVYIQGGIEEWVGLLDLKPVESGANMFLVAPFDEFVFYKTQKIQGVSVVSSIQLYLDLFNLNDRAREQAEVLYKKAISFQP